MARLVLRMFGRKQERSGKLQLYGQNIINAPGEMG